MASHRIEITINDILGRKEPKGVVYPSRQRKKLGRRRGAAFIELYDLAQVSTDGVTFNDHPLLKVPSYSTSYSGTGTEAKLVFTMEQFGTADYQAYTDMMFEIPVEEWHERYKRIGYTPMAAGYASSSFFNRLTTPHPGFFSMANRAGYQSNPFKPQYGIIVPEQTWIASDALVHADPDAHAREMLATVGMSWWQNYLTKMPVRGLTYLESEGNFGAEVGVGTQSWFPFSTTDKVNYKVTSTNDPGAADVGVIAPSGLTRIFLMPQIVSWAASTSHSNLEDRYVMGPVYQITPRKDWPRYKQTDWEHANGDYDVSGFTYNAVTTDPNDRKADFLEYQAARTGMQASSWTRPKIGSPTALSFNGAMSPASWPVTDNYFSQGTTSAAATDIWFNAGGVTAGSANPYRADLIFGTAEFDWFHTSDPFLCAVIQKGSRFYYVWMLEGAGEVTGDQGQKHRLSLKYDKNFADILVDDLSSGSPV